MSEDTTSLPDRRREKLVKFAMKYAKAKVPVPPDPGTVASICWNVKKREPEKFDCSSFIARLSYDVFDRYWDWFGDPSARTMSEKFETIGLPEPGDLVFYCRPNPDPDPDRNRHRPWLYHVMMSCGGGAVIGACGIQERVIRYECELYSPRWSRLDSPYRRFPAFTSTSPTDS